MNTPEETVEAVPVEASVEEAQPQVTPEAAPEPVVEQATAATPSPAAPVPRKIRKQKAPVVSTNQRLDALQHPTVRTQLTPEGTRIAVSTGIKTVTVKGFVKNPPRSPVTGRPVKYTRTYNQAPPAKIQAPTQKPPAGPVRVGPTSFKTAGINHPPAGLPVIRKSVLLAGPPKK